MVQIISIDLRTNKYKVVPFKARILETGFIRAESAVIGLLNGCMGMFMSIITTLFCGDVSRTHINLSDSIVTLVNVMNCGLIPMLGNCNNNITLLKAKKTTKPCTVGHYKLWLWYHIHHAPQIYQKHINIHNCGLRLHRQSQHATSFFGNSRAIILKIKGSAKASKRDFHQTNPK